MSVCVDVFIQECWPPLRLLILLTLIWWQVSNLRKISRTVLLWIKKAIDSHFSWNHWSTICLSKVSSWVSSLSKEWIWYAKWGISILGVWSISPITAFENIMAFEGWPFYFLFYFLFYLFIFFFFVYSNRHLKWI